MRYIKYKEYKSVAERLNDDYKGISDYDSFSEDGRINSFALYIDLDVDMEFGDFVEKYILSNLNVDVDDSYKKSYKGFSTFFLWLSFEDAELVCNYVNSENKDNVLNRIKESKFVEEQVEFMLEKSELLRNEIKMFFDKNKMTNKDKYIFLEQIVGNILYDIDNLKNEVCNER